MPGRGNVWARIEVLALLGLWRDEDVKGQMQNVHRNTPIYARLAELMSDQGWERTPEQCRRKIKAPKHDYNKTKANLQRSGTGSRNILANEEFAILDEVSTSQLTTKTTSMSHQAVMESMQLSKQVKACYGKLWDADSPSSGAKKRLSFGSNPRTMLREFRELTWDATPRLQFLSGMDETRHSLIHPDDEVETWGPEDEQPRETRQPPESTETPSVTATVTEILRIVEPQPKLSPVPQSPRQPPVQETPKLSRVLKIPKNDKRRSSYNFHGLVMSAHQKKQERLSYQCRVCRRDFTSRSGLQSHSRVHNVRGKHYECQVCHAMFATEKTMATHLKLHRRESYYHCSTCQKPFLNVTSLTKHQLTHPAVRPQSCPICGLSFVAKECLLQHITKIHPVYSPSCVVDDVHMHK
ncbi:zinc finger and SCAN domain-containing protein 32-like [Lineus longissimus]|uniref:zinc finger and SCAN domain-containing protein 32-like n=1 Tax=Lineus longissimus TaxID=88925 RepID=UPI00315D59B9